MLKVKTRTQGGSHALMILRVGGDDPRISSGKGEIPKAYIKKVWENSENETRKEEANFHRRRLKLAYRSGRDRERKRV